MTKAELQKDVLRRIKAVIRRLQKDGVVGMSGMNLYAITPTATLTCSVREYREAFAAALAVIERDRSRFVMRSTRTARSARATA